MIEIDQFKCWLKENTSYSNAVISDTVSRIKRADGILAWQDDDIYLFYLERKAEYKALSVSVRSQIKRAVKLYSDYRTQIYNF